MASFKYEDIVTRVGAMIGEGVLQPGDKAPSLRRLSEQMGVSVTSVLKAYTVLEGEGLLEAQPQSGFYVRCRCLSDLPEPMTSNPEPVRVAVAKSRLIASFLNGLQEPDTIQFGCASPDSSLLPCDELCKIIAGITRENRSQILAYSFPPGESVLIREIARRSLDWGLGLMPREIVVTSGGLDALNLSLSAVAEPGDAIAIESPTYFGVLQTIENHKLKAVEVPTHPRTGIDLDVLEDLLARKVVKACLLIPNFNNPLGCLMPDANKQRLAEMLARYQTPLLEDDVYGDLYFGASRPKPVKVFDIDDRVILCTSFSKILSPGLRVGFAASERYAEEIKNLQFMTTLAAPTLSQLAVARFLQSGLYDRHLRRMRRTLQAEVNRYIEEIGRLFPRGTRVSRPVGGFVLWLALPEGCDAVALYQKAMTHHISIAPGALFTARNAYSNYIRITCGMPWSPGIARALETLGQLVCQQVRKNRGSC